MRLHKLSRALLPSLLASAFLCVPAHGQPASPVSKPAAVPAAVDAKPPIIPTDDFVEPGSVFRPLISPNGQRLVFRERIGKNTYIALKPVDGTKIERIGLPEKTQLRWYRWANDNILLISMGGIIMLGGYELPTSTLLAYDLAQNKFLKLGKKSRGLEGDDILHISPDGKFLLLSISASLFDGPGVARIDIATNKQTTVVRAQTGIDQWIADNQGIVRMGIAYSATTARIYYRRTNEAKFELISKIREKDDDETKRESLIDISHVVAGRDDGYVLSNKETGRFALYKFNYVTREIGEKILGHDENDITDFTLNEDGTAVESARYTDERDRITWFNPVYQKYQRSLEKALVGQEAWIQSRSRDGKRMTVFSTSPTDPGSYYVYEPGAKRLSRFAGTNDRINPAQMAVTKYIRYPARDGLSIPGYLTLPLGRPATKLPLIIMPHGGPFGVRDTLDYNAEVQFLANRGYAVLQPNFRGSESYGEAFYKKGEGQIGRMMQDDLDDGMDWLVKSGVVDAARVCIVGSSYGGYAALWGVIRNPERYRCAASFAGVTDMKAQLRYSGRSMRSRHARRWQTTIKGADDFDLDTVSPAIHAAKLTRPVLITHGDSDYIVPFSQYKTMMAALKTAGKSVDARVYEGEGHGFNDRVNEKDWLDRLAGFLAKNNPAEPPAK
jgi:dipeptidyl aminopeptidase/acylaminoacyl peptidase